ncbi:MAG: hypothetical protein ABR582_04745 [Gemmatimonadaceae bacterium]
MTRDLTGIPELAGIATYETAGRVGFSVAENVDRLLRLHWAERRVMDVLLTRIASTPEWEVKCAMCLHQWYAAEHANALRKRISEMRRPVPVLDKAPDATLDAFFEELLRSADTIELVTGVYRVALRALRDAYTTHADQTNPLVDQPTRRMMRSAIADLDEAIAWGERAFEAMIRGEENDRERGRRWEAHLKAYLDASRGIAGDLPPDGDESWLPEPRAREAFVPNFYPARDERFSGQYNFNFPPHLVYNAPGIPADERNLALLCKRTLEMDVPEMMASFLCERTDQPWSFYYDYSRQLWDEARHAMLGTVGLTARGIDWKKIPLNVGFSLRLNLHAILSSVRFFFTPSSNRLCLARPENDSSTRLQKRRAMSCRRTFTITTGRTKFFTHRLDVAR